MTAETQTVRDTQKLYRHHVAKNRMTSDSPITLMSHPRQWLDTARIPRRKSLLFARVHMGQ